MLFGAQHPRDFQELIPDQTTPPPTKEPPPTPPRRLPPPNPPAITPSNAAVVATCAPSITMSVAIIEVLAETPPSQYGTMERFISSRVELSCKCRWRRPLSIIDLTS